MYKYSPCKDQNSAFYKVLFLRVSHQKIRLRLVLDKHVQIASIGVLEIVLFCILQFAVHYKNYPLVHSPCLKVCIVDSFNTNFICYPPFTPHFLGNVGQSEPWVVIAGREFACYTTPQKAQACSTKLVFSFEECSQVNKKRNRSVTHHHY